MNKIYNLQINAAMKKKIMVMDSTQSSATTRRRSRPISPSPEPREAWAPSCKVTSSSYLSSTSVHGLKYIKQEPHWAEKMFWFVACASAAALAAYMIALVST